MAAIEPWLYSIFQRVCTIFGPVDETEWVILELAARAGWVPSAVSALRALIVGLE